MEARAAMAELDGPPLRAPVDFAEFWAGTLAELAAVPAALASETVDRGPPQLALARLAFSSLGGARIQGYMLRWRDEAPRPLVVHGHGYGGHVTPRWAWARAGCNVAGLDVRGCGRSRDALPERSPWGWVLTGASSPERHVLRGAVCDYLRTVQVARELLGGAVTRTVLHGASFAGALALMAEGLGGVADLLALAVPSLGWAEGRRSLVRAGSGAEIERFLARRPAHSAEDLMVVLGYFDPVNFAGRVRCPALVGVGMADEVVPAATVLAVVAHLGGPHELMRFPVSHSGSPEERRWAAFERRWLRLAIDGVPEGFGALSGRARPPRAPRRGSGAGAAG
jgi:cephalosporin-C deacetylase